MGAMRCDAFVFVAQIKEKEILQMKKKGIALLLSIVCMLGATGLTACDDLFEEIASSNSSVKEDSSSSPMEEEKEELQIEMSLPVNFEIVINEYGFYHNQTLNNYYDHRGVDFGAAVGTEVKAAFDGVVESICKDESLHATEIVLDHGSGLKTVYRFVEERADLTVGATVKKGGVIATIAVATGEEYKDGPHLHFEVLKDGKPVDPTYYITLS